MFSEQNQDHSDRRGPSTEILGKSGERLKDNVSRNLRKTQGTFREVPGKEFSKIF